MRKEYHIDFYDLAHAEDYEGDFMELYTPSQDCAIRIKLPFPEETFHDAKWERVMYKDLAALGLMCGQIVWIEISY